MRYEDTIPKKNGTKELMKTAQQPRTKMSDVEKGLISLGAVAGAVYAIHSKRSFWGILGFMWLGSIAGGGMGNLFKKKED